MLGQRNAVNGVWVHQEGPSLGRNLQSKQKGVSTTGGNLRKSPEGQKNKGKTGLPLNLRFLQGSSERIDYTQRPQRVKRKLCSLVAKKGNDKGGQIDQKGPHVTFS